MAVYRLTDRAFSRQWRRSKDYSDHELRWLARRRGLTISVHKGTLQVLDRKGKAVATFQAVDEPGSAEEVSEKVSLYARLKT